MRIVLGIAFGACMGYIISLASLCDYKTIAILAIVAFFVFLVNTAVETADYAE